MGHVSLAVSWGSEKGVYVRQLSAISRDLSRLQMHLPTLISHQDLPGVQVKIDDAQPPLILMF